MPGTNSREETQIQGSSTDIPKKASKMLLLIQDNQAKGIKRVCMMANTTPVLKRDFPSKAGPISKKKRNR